MTEYNWGGEEDISGGLALADILGIFGREGLDLACYWTTPAQGSFAAAAYALYRNVDGAGAHFGDEGLSAHWDGAPPENVSLYAALDRTAGVATVIVVNKSGLPHTVKLRWIGIAVGAGRGYSVAENEPRVIPMPEPAASVQPLVIAPKSAVHLRFVLVP